MSLTIGVPRETFAGEKRVATVPDVVEKLIKLGFAVASKAVPGRREFRRRVPTRPQAPRSRQRRRAARRPTSSSRCARRTPKKSR